MNPRSLALQNVGRFTDLHLDFHPGCAAVVGPNGAGKSTILNSIELALFADGSRDLAGLLAPWADRLQIELTFEHDRELYRVRRGYKVGSGGRGTATLDLERNRLMDAEDERGERPDSWIPETRETADATQAHLEQLLGLSRATFNASSFLGQGNAAVFTEAKPAERKQILGAILDPRGLWPALADHAKTDARAIETTLAGDQTRASDREVIAGTIPALEEESQVALLAVGEAHVALDAAERTHTEAQSAVTGNAAAAERHRGASQALTAAQHVAASAREALAAAKTQADLLEPARQELEKLTAQADRVPELERLVEERRAALVEAETSRLRKTGAETAASTQRAQVGKLLSDRAALSARRDATTARLEHLQAAQDGAERCDRCEQLLGAEARQAALLSLQAELDALVAETVKADGAIDVAQGLLEDLDEASARVEIPAVPQEDHDPALTTAREASHHCPAIQIRIENYERDALRLPDLTDALRAAAGDVTAREQDPAEAARAMGDNHALEQTVAEAARIVTERRNTLTGAQTEQTRCDQRLEQARTAETELAEIRTRTRDAQTRLDLLKLAERAYGRDGIPALIAENAVPVIETEANRILEQMPTSDGVVLSVELRTQRALKSDADKLRETLDILVSDPDGVRAYETFSGGEQARVNIALRVSLARLLAGRRGADVQLLAIDELDHLDAVGFTGLVAVLKEMQASVEKILIVSHHPDLQLAFADRIEISKRDGVSELVGAREAEAVPA